MSCRVCGTSAKASLSCTQVVFLCEELEPPLDLSIFILQSVHICELVWLLQIAHLLPPLSLYVVWIVELFPTFTCLIVSDGCMFLFW